MKTAYKDYTIETEATILKGGGWIARVHIFAGDVPRVALDFGRDVTFATSELADQAALLLGRAWVDRFRSR
jgi:hypothetical protein